MDSQGEKTGHLKLLDIGCSSGSSMEWASRNFGGSIIGVDLDKRKIRKAHGRGFDARHMDARALAFDSDAFDIVTMFDFLEHLSDEKMAHKVISEALRVCHGCLLVQGPDFENEEALERIGMRRVWSNWRGHTFAITTRFLMRAAKNSRAHIMALRVNEVYDTYDRNVVPSSTPVDTLYYDPSLHGPKEYIQLPRKLLYNRMIAILAKDENADIRRMEQLLMKLLILNTSSKLIS